MACCAPGPRRYATASALQDSSTPVDPAGITLTAFLPGQPGKSIRLDRDRPYTMGRSPRADLTLDHAGVSRIHLVIEAVAAGWQVTDQVSKNGTRLDGRPIDRALLTSTAWLEVGGVPLLAHIPSADEEAPTVRREPGPARRGEPSSAQSLEVTLDRSLSDVVRLSGCERAGLWLADASGDPRLASGTTAFVTPPSLTAIRKAFETGTSEYCSDTDGARALASSGSIARSGIRALLAIPVVRDSAVIAVVYADSLMPGKLFTEHDAALLEAAARQLALVVDSGRIRETIDSLRRDL